MATRPRLALHLLRDPADQGPPAEPTSPAPVADVGRALHRRVRTYANVSVPKGRRIKPPSDEQEDATNADDPPHHAGSAFMPVHRVQELLEIYTRFMGPASKRVLDAQLAELGASPRTLAPERLRALVKKLAARIDTPERRRGFLKAMTKFPGALG